MTTMKFLRQHKSLTQKALGQLSKLGQATVSRIETGRLRATPKETTALAAVLGCTSAQLFKEVRTR